MLAAGKHPVQRAGWWERGVSLHCHPWDVPVPLPAAPGPDSPFTGLSGTLISARPHFISAHVPRGHLDSKGMPGPAKELETGTFCACKKVCSPLATSLHVWFEEQGEEHWSKGYISRREQNWVLMT